MSHHGSELPPESVLDAVRHLFGETGRFPRGKLNSTDEGEIRLGVCVDKGTVIINFGKPVAWLGMTPEQAADLGDLLRRRADEAGSWKGDDAR